MKELIMIMFGLDWIGIGTIFILTCIFIQLSYIKELLVKRGEN